MPNKTALLVPALALAACAGPPPSLDEIPAALRVPPGQTMFLETLAVGVQIYRCAPSAETTASYAWAFVGPEASLFTRQGKIVGRHFAGPTWQLDDGSSLVGAVRASDPGPKPDTSIPWLLLDVKSTTSPGQLQAATSVQRVRTRGGKAPTQRCSAAEAGQAQRVDYAASYYFYRAAN